MLFDYKSTILHWLQLPITESRSAGSPPITGSVEYVERFHDGQELSPLDAKFEAFVKRTLYEYKVPGVAIAVINGNSTFARGYGTATYPDEPVTPETLFFTGSTTKAFTAAAISLLVDDNENYTNVQWTTPISELIRDDFVLPDDYSTNHLTLQDALSHRTGMPRHDLSYGQEGSTTRDIVRSIRYLPLTKPLRTTFQYCNIMVATMGYVIEQLTGQRLVDVFSKRIWEPLNMTSTFLSLSATLESKKPLATAYHWSDASGLYQVVSYMNETAGEGAGMIISNMLDYSKWVRMMMTRAPPISPAGHEALVTPQMIMGKDVMGVIGTSFYGQGWMLQSYRGVDVVFHGGSVDGFGAMVFYIPSRNWGTVMAANTASTSNMVIDIILWALVDDLLDVPISERDDHNAKHEKELAQTRQMRNTTFAREKYYPSATTGDLAPSLPLQEYAGMYSHLAYKELTLEYVNQTLEINIERPSTKAKIKMQPISGEYFLGVGFSADNGDDPLYVPAEFKVDVSGQAVELGLLLEEAMAPEKIWFERTNNQGR